MCPRSVDAARDLDPLATRLARDLLHGVDEPATYAQAAHVVGYHHGRDPRERRVAADHVPDVDRRQADDDAVELRDENVLTRFGGHVGQSSHDLLGRGGIAELTQQFGDSWSVLSVGSAYLHAG